MSDDVMMMVLVMVVGQTLVTAALIWLLWGFWRAINRLHAKFMVLELEVRDLRAEQERSR